MTRSILILALCAAGAVCGPAFAQGTPAQAPAAAAAAAAGLRYDSAKPDTWRGRPEWAGFRGARAGYWFAPGYGYQPVDARLAGHAWRRGDVLGAGDRARFVQTPAFYGLRPPPPGYRWVYYNGDFLLADVTTGLVGQVVAHGY